MLPFLSFIVPPPSALLVLFTCPLRSILFGVVPLLRSVFAFGRGLMFVPLIFSLLEGVKTKMSSPLVPSTSPLPNFRPFSPDTGFQVKLADSCATGESEHAAKVDPPDFARLLFKESISWVCFVEVFCNSDSFSPHLTAPGV